MNNAEKSLKNQTVYNKKKARLLGLAYSLLIAHYLLLITYIIYAANKINTYAQKETRHHLARRLLRMSYVAAGY